MKPPEEYGSSPLARGTRLRCRVLLLCRRLIPARVGNTDNPKAAAAYRAAHPRSRGEHPIPDTSLSLSDGSSPLARGTHVLMAHGVGVVRLIPARAGNTSGSGACVRGSTAHPRSRGEHGGTNSLPRTNNGSSPLARGTP